MLINDIWVMHAQKYEHDPVSGLVFFKIVQLLPIVPFYPGQTEGLLKYINGTLPL